MKRIIFHLFVLANVMCTQSASALGPAESTPASHTLYQGASGPVTQLLCHYEELRAEEKFVSVAVHGLSKLSILVNPDDMASIQKKEQDKQKAAIVKKIFQTDYNGDGKVSLDEVKKYEQIRQREFDKQPKRNDGVRTDADDLNGRVAQTMKNDTNKDGIIEYNELMAANGFLSAEVMKSGPKRLALSQQYAEQKELEKEKITQDARNAFAAVDLNKDHVHSKEECDAYTGWLEQLGKGH